MQAQSVPRPTAQTTHTPDMGPPRHYPSLSEVRGVTFDEITLMLFLEKQPDTGPPLSAWDALAKKVERSRSPDIVSIADQVYLFSISFINILATDSILAKMERPGVPSISRSR